MTHANFMKQIEAEKEARVKRLALMDSYINGQPSTDTHLPEYIRAILRDAKEAGYSCWRGFHHNPCNPFSLQKRIENERGDRLYFINLDLWDLGLEFPDRYNGHVNIAPSGQFYLPPRRDGTAIDLSMHLCNTDTLDSIEAFYKKFYETMGCVPYETAEER